MKLIFFNIFIQSVHCMVFVSDKKVLGVLLKVGLYHIIHKLFLFENQTKNTHLKILPSPCVCVCRCMISMNWNPGRLNVVFLSGKKTFGYLNFFSFRVTHSQISPCFNKLLTVSKWVSQTHSLKNVVYIASLQDGSTRYRGVDTLLPVTLRLLSKGRKL